MATKTNKISKTKSKLQLTHPEFGVKKIFSVQTKYALERVKADFQQCYFHDWEKCLSVDESKIDID